MPTLLKSLAHELDILIRKQYLLSLAAVPPEYPLYTKVEEWDKNGSLFAPLMRREQLSTIEPATPIGETEAVNIQSITDGRTKDLDSPIRFATGLSFSQDKMKMGISNTSSVNKVVGLLQDAVRMTMETYWSQLINDADNVSAPSEMLGFDGLPPISTAHTLQGGGTASNKFASNSSVSYTTLNEVLSAVTRTVDEAGNYHNLYRVNELWVPVEEELNAYEALKSTTRPDTTNRADNVITNRSAQSLSMSSVKTLLYMTNDRWFAVDGARHEIKRYVLENTGVEGPIIDPLTKIHTWIVEFWIHRAVWEWRGLYMIPKV